MRKLFIFVIFLSTVFFSGKIAFAANPKAILSWQAKSYAPPGFQGKILPGQNSPVVVSLEVIDNKKIVDLSPYRVFWYTDGDVSGKGMGLQYMTFRVPAVFGGGSTKISINIPDYPGGALSKSVIIPIASPSVVLSSSYPQNNFKDKSFKVRVLPYFFGVPDLSYLNFSWLLNGSQVMTAENPQELLVNINSDAAVGSVLSVKAMVKNPKGNFEAASDQKNFTYSP